MANGELILDCDGISYMVSLLLHGKYASLLRLCISKETALDPKPPALAGIPLCSSNDASMTRQSALATSGWFSAGTPRW